MSAPAAPKLKLLCLHGYMQNAEIFRSRLGSMRKALKSRVEFVFVDAPFEAQGLPGDDPEEVQGARDGRSWWQWTDSGPAGRPSKAASYTGWPEAQSFLVAALREHRPDGLLGFSQGATAAALLLSHLASPEAAAEQAGLPQLKAAVLVAGFLPRDPAVAALVRGQLQTPPASQQQQHEGAAACAVPMGQGGEQRAPSGGRRNTVPLLFVGGTSDALVPPERTAQLYDCFDPATVSVYTHSGAHLVPTCSGEFKSALVAFLDAAAAGGAVPPIRRVQSQAGLAASAPAGGTGGPGMSASQSTASLASSEGGATAGTVAAAAAREATEGPAAVGSHGGMGLGLEMAVAVGGGEVAAAALAEEGSGAGSTAVAVPVIAS